MKNLSNTKKALLGVGILVVGYYAWKMWQSNKIEEKNKKAIASAVANPDLATTATV